MGGTGMEGIPPGTLAALIGLAGGVVLGLSLIHI
jgi:hypothetical protein